MSALKTISTILLAITFLSVNASANTTKFYNKDVGQWTIEGYRGDPEFCSAKTFWDNGSYMSLFSVKNEKQMGLYIHNKEWNISDPTGFFPEYVATIHFFGKQNGRDSGTIEYELIDNQTIILRNVNEQFIKNWIIFAQMEIVMPGNIGRMSVGLNGTRELTPAFVECIEILEGKNYGTNL